MTSPLAFVFPGQGSQTVGMGRAVYEASARARAVFDEADRILGYKLSEICFNGPAEKLDDTRVAQPAILTTSVALLEALAEGASTVEGRISDGHEPRGVAAMPADLRPSFVAGHLLGGFSAIGGDLASFMRTIKFREPVVPVVANTSGAPHQSGAHIPDALVRHLSQRVEWLRSVRFMAERGASTFVEIGAGQVVNGLVKRIADVKLLNVSDPLSITGALSILRERAAAAPR